MLVSRDVDDLWSTFLDYLDSPQGDDEESLQALMDRLRAIKTRLADRKFLEGDTLSSNDLALVARLHHIFSALPQLKVIHSRPCKSSLEASPVTL